MTSTTIKTQLTHCFNNTFSKTSTPIPIANIAGERALSSGLDKLKHFLVLSLLTTLSFNVFAVDNPQQLNKEEFNKAAYLDLSKPYNGNNPQPVSEKYNQATTLLKEVAGTVRNALGSTNSDNADQLGNKITTGISNQIKNQAVNKTEGLINSKANKLLNKFGAGRSEVSIGGISSKKLSYNIDTIQPLSEFNSKIKALTFIQGSLFNAENEGSRRNTLNLGLGHRMLVEDDRAIVGINIFTDYEANSKHKRASLGLEYQRSNFSLTANKYHPLSNKVVIGDYTEEALSGHDIKVTGQIPYIPWAKIKGTHYYWDQSTGGSINGSILGVEIQLSPSSSIEFGQEDSNTMEHSGYARLNLSFPFNTNEKMTNFAFDKKAFRNSTKMDLTLLEMVERSQQIKIEKLLNKHATQSATSATVAEAGTATYTIVLSRKPTSDVAISLTSSDTTAATVTPLLTFTRDNWSSPQMVTVTGVNDGDTDNETVVISHAISGGGYDAVSMTDFTVTMVDDDGVTQLTTSATAAITQLAISATVAGVTQSATAMIMSEGRTGAYTIVLNSEPEGDVTITLTSSDTTAATVTNSLTFTTSNWSSPQTVTVTAVNDPDMDNETVTIRHAISGDGYGSVNMSDIEVRIIDRTPNPTLKSIIQSTTVVNIDENATDTYTVVLDADPTGDVVIAMTSSDTNIVTVTPSLTFTTNNWATPQIVTVTSVLDINVDKAVYVSHTVTGGGYNAVTMSDILVHVSDVPGEFVNKTCKFWLIICVTWQWEVIKPQSIIQSATSATIAEAATSTYTVVLSKKPTSDVTIRLTSSDTTAATVTPLLTFTRSNWSSPQMVTITGVNDNDAVREIVTISHAISGGGYDTVSMTNFTAIMIDDDTAGVTQSATSATIAESATATYTVVLDSEPTSDVTIRLTSSDTTAATVTPLLTFTRSNWSSPQMVTITGVNDGDTANETVVISHAISGGGYDALSMTNFTATMIDDDIIFKGLSYTLITSPDTGRIWLDRNLGATRVATSSTDSTAYGHLYQWGRNDDGHESRTSNTTTTRATTITPAHNNFIVNNITYNWTSADSNGALRAAAWADGGSNNICPVGFGVPTEAELTADTISATTTTITNKDTAFSSFLKIPVAGYRNANSVFTFVNAHIFLWTRSTSGSIGRYLTINSGAGFHNSYRAYALSVRCIKS
ncbi:hypothetical protein [uncultured Gammaproteobacteria bacterium]|nr:hypothetical protein [uncultured Gammaproteobacteria bacterium]CAC9507274.1 hypothetical protein [uncultured Gammaproteobacteria bacterium]